MNASSYEVPHCGTFFTPVHILLVPNYSSEDPVLKYPQPAFHPQYNVSDYIS